EVPTEWGVWFDDLFKAPMIASSLQSLNTNEFKVESWSERNRRLFYSLKFERVTMFLILSIMILIASFNILSLILMMSVDKTKEIAIFRSIGLSQNGVQKIFLRMGFYLGLIGTSLGLFLGVAAVAYLKWKPLKLPSLYYLEGLPIQWDLSILITVVLIAPLISLLSSWYPARRAAQQEIVTALRYD
ncbi:MAG: ABC transporter permease, partial [Deltaproteobacteria bacterium]|nr:ABC transporter permease [Deltaproteobacteria bacterium]